LPADVSTTFAEGATVPARQLHYGGTNGKAGRNIQIIDDGSGDKKANSWVVAPKSKDACNLQYVALASRIEGRELTPREKLDGTLAHFAVAYGQCPTDASIPAIVVRYRYGVALKDMCRHHGYLTCGDSFKVLKLVLADVQAKAYIELLAESPDRRARVFEEQVVEGINEVFFYAVEKTTYFRKQQKSWDGVNVCPLLLDICAHPLASSTVQKLAKDNMTALNCASPTEPLPPPSCVIAERRSP
jgi:hypothetical protein